MRNVEELKKIKDRRPFQPFHIHLSDGRDLLITHPDNVAWNPGDLTRIVFLGHTDGWEVVDLAHITSIRVPYTEATRDSAT